MTQTPVDRLLRNQAASDDPSADLAWWLWDLADDPVGRQLPQALSAVRRVDEFGRLLLRERILKRGRTDSFEALAEWAWQRWGRRVSRQALHNRELDLRRELEAAFTLLETSAVVAYLDRRLAAATHLDDLATWERVVLTTHASLDTPWPSADDCAALVATFLARRFSMVDGWWLRYPKVGDIAEGAQWVVDTLLTNTSPLEATPLDQLLTRSGITACSGERLAVLLVAQKVAIAEPERTVLFPQAATRTLGDCLKFLCSLLDIDVDEAATMLEQHHHRNARTLANVVRDVRRGHTA